LVYRDWVCVEYILLLLLLLAFPALLLALRITPRLFQGDLREALQHCVSLV